MSSVIIGQLEKISNFSYFQVHSLSTILGQDDTYPPSYSFEKTQYIHMTFNYSYYVANFPFFTVLYDSPSIFHVGERLRNIGVLHRSREEMAQTKHGPLKFTIRLTRKVLKSSLNFLLSMFD